MKIDICPTAFCGRPFQLNIFSVDVVPSYEAGQIICPHCGHTYTAGSKSIFVTHALLPDDERKFLAQSLVGGICSSHEGGARVKELVLALKR
jgi:hypothetical protein